MTHEQLIAAAQENAQRLDLLWSTMGELVAQMQEFVNKQSHVIELIDQLGAELRKRNEAATIDPEDDEPWRESLRPDDDNER